MASWYDALPALVAELAVRWGLGVGEAGGGGTSRVYRCLRDGETVWLKLTPDPVIATDEAEALRAWADTRSVVGLLDQDLRVGALLLAGVEPGTRLMESGWQLAHVARLLVELRSVTYDRSPQLAPLADRITFLYDLADRRGTADPDLLSRGRAAALEMARTGPADGLVHGDLHPGNVLIGAGGRLVAIDPRPALGDPDFDAVDWVIEGVEDEQQLERRIVELAALVPGMSAARVLGWCRATAPLIGGAPAFLAPWPPHTLPPHGQAAR
ncbi:MULTISPECIES: aminoglycoside phosphotransferase family protein [unclassified Streptomyces]|uniref:aminoglycoside phosphotransferase family protein n=1 Tax=unclassified Streptomyces TaxID=2593676 RepID=UPI0020251089|nr:aminoglycoside phosphotransferase family protein [Streptomyces sp. A 4/2]